MRFYIETFGCTSNFGDSQELAEALQEMGHVTSLLEEADAVIVNTCAVTERTERKILRRLRQLEGERLVVAGCLPAALPHSIRGISCRASLGTLKGSAARRITEIFEGSAALAQEGSHSSLLDPPDSRALPSPSPPTAPPSSADALNLCRIVNVAQGCNGGCSYCIVRAARGRLISRRPEEVVLAVQKLVRSGAVEIQLAAQDVASWGLDIGSCLPELLQRVAEVPGGFRVRVGMMNADSVRPIQRELIEAFAGPRVYKFLHLPVQSGSNKVLQDMGRRYLREDFLDIVADFRASIPDLYLTTDVIVGFPTETESDFRQTMDLIKHLQPDKVNITRFSPRPGTPAAELYDMPDRIKKERSRELTRLWLEIAAARNRLYEGRILEVLVTEKGTDGTMKARAENYLGVVIEGNPRLGSFMKVLVTSSNPFFVLAL